MNWSLKSCRRQRQEISLWMAGTISPEEIAAVQRHMDACPRCRGFHHELMQASQVLIKCKTDLADIPVPPSLQARWTREIQRGEEESSKTLLRERGRPLSGSESTTADAPSLSWHEWLVSFRWHLTGLSALWLVIGILSWEPSEPAVSELASQRQLSTEQMVAAFRENRRKIKELTEPPMMATDWAPLPQSCLPRRRSEIECQTELV